MIDINQVQRDFDNGVMLCRETIRQVIELAGDRSKEQVPQTDWLEFVRRAKLIYNDGDEGMQALDYLLALVDTSITAADLASKGKK